MSTLPTCGWFETGSPVAAALSDVELFTKSPPVAWSGGGGGGGMWGAAARAGAYAEPLGCSFVQLFQALPSLAWAYPLGFENRFNAFPWGELVRRYGWVPFLACALYCLACFVGVRVMAGRPALSLRGPLRAWNLGLAVFSAIGFLRTAPHLAHTIATQGLYVSVRSAAAAPPQTRFGLLQCILYRARLPAASSQMCAPAEGAFGYGAVGLWLFLFVMSKFPELIDTAFIVLKKGDLIFLHWYHHITVLLFCWQSYATRSSTGIYFAVRARGAGARMRGALPSSIPAAPLSLPPPSRLSR